MFKSLECLPMDPTFKLFNQFKADPSPNKVNLGIGLYFDRQGQPVVLEAVKKAVKDIDLDNFYYQPIGGNKDFLESTGRFIFGDSFDANNLAMQATCGGTQACRCFSDLALKVLHSNVIQVATPTWVNYYALFAEMEIQEFPHCQADGSLNFQAYLDAAKRAPEGSAFLIQGALAHNPSGINLSLDQLKKLIEILEEKKMILFMDMAYMGLSEGIEKDREFIELCYQRLERFAIGISFSKNASLYEHRCGALFVKTVNNKCTESQLQKSIRETISTPPSFGQEVMTNIFQKHFEAWQAEVEAIRQDIDWRRKTLVDLLPSKFQHLKNTRGMFGLLPLSKDQVLKLRSEYSIYLLDNGRINFAGIKEADMEYIASSIKQI